MDHLAIDHHPNGVRDLSPSTDVVCRSTQKHFFSPIGSPMSKQFNDLVKPYNLFCSKTPEIANVIDVVSQNNTDNGLRNWETSLIQSSADYLPFGHPINSPQKIGEVSDQLPGDVNMDSSLIYKLGNLSVSMDIWQSPKSPSSMTPPITPSPTPARKTLYSWSHETLPGLKVMDPLCTTENPTTLMDYKELRAIWADNGDHHHHRSVRSSFSVPNHQAEYLLNSRGRSFSNNTRNTRSRSTSRSNSPGKREEDNILLGRTNQVPAVHGLGDSPPSMQSELPNPIPIPKKISKIPLSVSTTTTTTPSVTRSRLSTHPMSRAFYSPLRPPIYPICNYEIPSDYNPPPPPPVEPNPSVPMPLPHPLNSFPFPRSIHHHFMDEDFLQDGKIRSRSLGEGTRDKSAVPGHRYRHKAKMTRHRRNSSTRDEDLSRYELDVSRVLSGQDTRTTLMIKNIPNKYDQEMLLEAINYNFKGTYDFFYLPIDFKNKCNVGYAFINFINYLTVANFYQEFNQKKWEKFNSEKVCKITFARIQGKSAFIDHFRNSSLMYEDPACRPLIFHSSGPSIGQLENFPPANISRSLEPSNLEH